jgi:outer membrane murein-binding lipoprotein Lpp
MRFTRNHAWVLVGVTWGVLGGVLSGCASSRPAVVDTARTEQLTREVTRLNQRVASLSVALAAQNARIEQSARETEALPRLANDESVACHGQSELRAEPTGVNVELELRAAQRALIRVIERLNLTADAKRELLQSLKPARSLDTENPWVAAK